LHDSKIEPHSKEEFVQVNQNEPILSGMSKVDSLAPHSFLPESLPPVALLLSLAYQVQIEASDILQFCVLPPDILKKALKDDPTLPSLDLPDPFNPTPTDVHNVYTHRMMLALTLLETAWHQTEERITDKQRIAVGIEIGKVGIEVLRGYVCAKDERGMARKAKKAMSTSNPNIEKEDSSIATTRTRRTSSETRSTSPEKKKVKLSHKKDDDVKASRIIRKTSSIRPDFQTDYGIKEVKPTKTKMKLDPAAKWEKKVLEAETMREKEGQRVLQGVEEVISKSVSRIPFG
jgi:hypothetical protein